MAPVTRGKGNQFAHLEDIHNREETVREEQEAQFVSLREQIEALTKEMSIVGGHF